MLEAVLSASTDFLSHSDPPQPLSVHCEKVGSAGQNLCTGLNVNCADAVYYAGVLHDVGKINPLYQIPFHRLTKNPGETGREFTARINAEMDLLAPTYIREHAVFSAWAAYKLLTSTTLTTKQLMQTVCAIAGHHGQLRNHLTPRTPNTANFTSVQTEIQKELKNYKASIPNNYNQLDNLDWNKCIAEYANVINPQMPLASNANDWQEDFLESGFIFSALLQGDKGSFRHLNNNGHLQTPQFDLAINTDNLVPNQPNNLSNLRQQFNDDAVANHDYTSNVYVLHAPTGIGKTKVFLDLVNEHCNPSDPNRTAQTYERLIYFSPLLALTDDFGQKIQRTVANQDLQHVIEYNHLFRASLEEKLQQNGMIGIVHRDFLYESFNHKFIIATTQRLIRIIYSNRSSDKLKLASLKNSFLIVDEVQTIPKFLIPNFVQMLSEIANRLNSKVLLVSATIPHELSSFNLPTYQIPTQLLTNYQNATQKNIRYENQLQIPNQFGKLLIMANTRRKARDIFLSSAAHNPDYITSGVVKYDRIDRIRNINTMQQGMIVATQVIEAGVDVSFSEVYREVAPLDNIVQVMGRLNRNAQAQTAELVVYRNQTPREWQPYSQLEWTESFNRIQNIHNSTDLYNQLDNYYNIIHQNNQNNQTLTQDLQDEMELLNFEGVWEFVRDNTDGREQDSVFIPRTNQEWTEAKDDLLNPDTRRDARGRLAMLTATLPRQFEVLDRDVTSNFTQTWFDNDLLQEDILMPNWNNMADVYDDVIGLDRWIS